MKKIISLLVIVLALSCTACGSEKPSVAVSPNQNSVQEIKMEPAYVAIDDENIKMEITSVSVETMGVGTVNELTEYKVNCSVTNKSSQYDLLVSISIGDGYVGQHAVSFMNGGGNTRAGKTNDGIYYSCIDYKDDGSQNVFDTEGVQHITSLEDLLQFNARVRIKQYIDDGKQHLIVNTYVKDIALGE